MLTVKQPYVYELKCDFCGKAQTFDVKNPDGEFEFSSGIGSEVGYRGWVQGWNWTKYSGIQFTFCSRAHEQQWQQQGGEAPGVDPVEWKRGE